MTSRDSAAAVVLGLAAVVGVALSAWPHAGLAMGNPPMDPGGPTSMPERTAKPVFYPSPPDVPRFQFLFSFSDASAWAAKGPGSAPDAEAGQSKPTSLSKLLAGESKTEPVKGKIENPYGIAARDGKLYVCDVAFRCCHIVDFANRKYCTLGDGKNLVRPLSITIAPDGTRYVCDMALRQVAVFDADDKFVTHLGDPKLCPGPADVAVFGDDLLVVDQVGGKVQVWSKKGELKRTIGGPGKAPEQFQRPGSVAVDAKGLIYVGDMLGSTVKVFDPEGKFVRTIGEPGDRPGNLTRPKGVRIDPANGLVYVADAHWSAWHVFNLEGQLLMFVREANEKPYGMNAPTGIALDATSIKHFQKYIDKDFQPEYLVFVSDEFGVNKICVYAFGRPKAAGTTTKPATTPPK